MKKILVLLIFTLILITNNINASGPSIMVFAPHPDDEVLMTSGVIYQALQNGRNVKVVIVTNGDYSGGEEEGEMRIGESINGLSVLGVNQANIYFLGYGDYYTLPGIASAPSPDDVYPSNVGSYTYGSPNFGVTDYHMSVFGTHGLYNRSTILTDLEDILCKNKPDKIYVPSNYEGGDHSATYKLIMEALIEVKKSNSTYCPAIFQYLVHNPVNGDWYWPVRSGSIIPFTIPYISDFLKYKTIIDIPVPSEMLLPIPQNKKYQAINQYQSQLSQMNNFLISFIKSDEFFWKSDFSNLAFNATVTVSSENTNTRQLGIKATDGILDGYPNDSLREWATLGQTSNVWIRLTWSQSQTINRITLYDRLNNDDQILHATLSFSDGSVINVGTLANNGSGNTFNFPRRTINWVQLNISEASGVNTGLAEFEVYNIDSPNLAFSSTVTVSSRNSDTGQYGIKAIDGIVNGSPDDFTKEWATLGKTSNAWIRLTWSQSQIINRIKLYDRIGSSDWISNASLIFSDGSSINIGNLTNNGSGNTIDFPRKTVNWVQLNIIEASGLNTGLAEFEVYNIDPPNLALCSDVTVSSQNSGAGQSGAKAIDGIVNGYPDDPTKEWATDGQTSGAWIRLTWIQSQTIHQIVLYDRPNTTDCITDSILYFSDGSSIQVGGLPDNETGETIDFPDKTVTWVKLTINQTRGANTGLAEFQVY